MTTFNFALGMNIAVNQPEVFMRLILLTLTLLISSSTFACTADEGTLIRKFLAKLVAEVQYDGSENISSAATGETPITETRTASYNFTRAGSALTVYKVFCSSGADGQCEAEEESWQLIKNCLYVDGNRMRVISSSVNGLRFEFDDSGRLQINRYDLISRRRLRVGIITTAPSFTDTRWFLGRGT